jgi:hypothetical protein
MYELGCIVRERRQAMSVCFRQPAVRPERVRKWVKVARVSVHRVRVYRNAVTFGYKANMIRVECQRE